MSDKIHGKRAILQRWMILGGGYSADYEAFKGIVMVL